MLFGFPHHANYGSLQEDPSIFLGICFKVRIPRHSIAKQGLLATGDVSQKNLLQTILLCFSQRKIFSCGIRVSCQSALAWKDPDECSAPPTIDKVDEIDVDLAKSLRPLHQHRFPEPYHRS